MCFKLKIHSMAGHLYYVTFKWFYHPVTRSIQFEQCSQIASCLYHNHIRICTLEEKEDEEERKKGT